ncbi:MAG: hypothetical protein U0176_04535 [Bacteroidia bacterium]
MHQSKLVTLLRTFRPAEMRRFEDFLSSPYFNKSGNLIAMFRAIRESAPEFSPEGCDRFAVWERAHPGRPGSEQEIATEMNALLRLAETFLGMEQYHQKEQLRDLHILEAMEKRPLEKHFRLQLKRIHQRLEMTPVRDEQHFWWRYQAAGTEVREMLNRQARTYDANLQEMVDDLDDFYLISRLRLTCELINRQFILSGHYDTGLTSDLLAHLSNYDHEKVPAMAAYYMVLRLLTGEAGEESFQGLSRLLVDNAAALGGEYWRELFSYAQNYSIRQVRAGEASYLGQLLRLYRAALDSGNIMEDGVLSAWKYKNIASVGLRLAEYDWVEGFINRYKPMLPEDLRENAYAYNLADLHYHRREYDQALRCLLRVEFTDVFYSLDTRKMMLMIYFEQGATEAMLSLISSFRTFLKRNQLISEHNRLAYTHFVNLVQAIYRTSESDGDVGKLRSQIAETQPLVEEAWLLEKAAKGYQ